MFEYANVNFANNIEFRSLKKKDFVFGFTIAEHCSSQLLQVVIFVFSLTD